MSLQTGASRVGSPTQRSPEKRRPVPLPIGAAGLALAVALGAIPLAAAATGVERAATKVSPPPDTAGLHPIDYSFERLAPFSGGFAAVQWQGKWGYIDKNGKVVVPFLYDNATLFDGNWASVWKNGRYTIIDKAGAEVTLPRPLAKLSRFSGGLAAAKTKIGGPWGYVDGIGTFVIQPRFDSADDFSSGLAAVAVQGTWFYVTPSGTIALVTPYYRAYAFTEDGLALVQEKQGGRYGYIDSAGKEVIPPQYHEARLFSQGLAPVRVGDRWGYITTSGATAIPPRYSEAYPFVGGRALVLDGLSSYYFIDSTGERVHDSPFAMAESFSDGAAIVSDGLKYWYVDEVMTRLPIGEAVPPTAGDSGGCSGASQAVSTSYVGGLNLFRIVNQTTMRWTVAGANLSSIEGHPGMSVYPGLPVFVEPVANATNGIYTFLHHYVTMDTFGYPTKTYPLFQMELINESYNIMLEVANDYKAPPSTTHPWWDWLKYAIGTAKAIYGMMSGDEASGVLELLEADYDQMSGADDNQANNNANAATDDNLLTTLTVTKSGVGQLAPLDGGFCGGDSYTVSDGESYVFALKTAKTSTMPPTVELTITPYSEFFALNAQAKLDLYRKGLVTGVPVPAAPLAGCIYAMAFENYSDIGNNNPCYHPSAFPQYDYFATASKLPAVAALDWWDFANNLETFGHDPPTVQKWLRAFGGVCGTLPSSCPSVLPMAVSPQSCTQSTWEPECSCVFTVTNANGPIGQKLETNVPSVDATTTCALAAPFVSPCTITFKPAAGSSAVKITITDTDTEVPVSLTCTTQKMTVSPLTYSGASGVGPCNFNVQVAGPVGLVSATPATFVTSTTCKSATSGTCVVNLAVPSGTPATSISLSDGTTTLPISVACKDIPMTLNDDKFPLYSAGQACPWTVGVANAHGPVVVTPASVKSSSTCTGPAPSCTVAVSIPYNIKEMVSFSDGASTVTAPFSCTTYPCEGGSLGLPWGKEYSTGKHNGCSVTVPLFCASGAIRFNYAPVGGSVTPIICTPSVQCNAQIWAYVGGTWELHDDMGNTADINVTCD